MHKIINICYFLCGLNKFEQKNQLSVLDKEKIEEYQKNEFQTDIQFSNEIKALKINSETTITI
ncbi:hypothetical protein [Borreliella garinii]|uniref:hypothetical protein n=1 Tax=Borreliella garinii TaxID=29519 RepID=UPI0004D6E9E1|nr:hypothetical protein [Borreliella garinii]KEO62804.1 hypothetical protein DM10_00350 [Borreliella garinii]